MDNIKGVPTCQSLAEMQVLESELEKVIPGDLAEVGVYMGGTAKLMAEVCPDRQIYVFDTFEGHPYVDQDKGDSIKENWVGGMKEATLEICKENLKGYKNVHITKGVFPEGSEIIKDKKFAFVHLDTDTWRSMKAGIEFFFPRMLKGGVLVIHDYQNYKGVKKAVDDFLEGTEFKVELSAERQGIIRC